MYKDNIFLDWKDKVKSRGLFKSFIHLDNKFDIGENKNFLKIKDKINNLNKHQFLPFLKRIKKNKKYKYKNKKTIKETKERPIMYASHTDSQVYSFYNYLISIEYEKYININNITNNITAYRKIEKFLSNKGKSNIDHVSDVIEYIKKEKDCIILMIDIKGFFDNLNHKILKEKIKEINSCQELSSDLYKVFKSLTRYDYINYADFESNYKKLKNKRDYLHKIWKDFIHKNETNIGIPQGSPMSGLLANIYMIDFDKYLASDKNYFYKRYSDDILIIIKDQSLLSKLQTDIKEEINKLKLTIQNKKTNIIFVKNSAVDIVKIPDEHGNMIISNKNSFDYLGIEFTNINEVRVRKKTFFNSRKKSVRRIKKMKHNVWYKKRNKINNKKISYRKNTYFERASEILGSKYIKRQALKIRQIKNKTRKCKKYCKKLKNWR